MSAQRAGIIAENQVDALENSKERQDALLDHGIKESCAGSDPVSVQVSKYAVGDPRGQGEGETPTGPKDMQKGRTYVKDIQDTVSAHPVAAAAVLAGLIGCATALIAYEALSQPREQRNRRRPSGANERS